MKFDRGRIVWISGIAYSDKHPLVKQLYGETKTKDDAQPVGGLPNSERKPNPLPALDDSPKKHGSRKRGVASGITVHIIRFGARLFDSDNFVSGAKPIRDAVAKSLALDDNDAVINWKYHQIIAEEHGTLVTISVDDAQAFVHNSGHAK